MAKILMVFDTGVYTYGTYPYRTDAEKSYVNEIAIKIRKERGCFVHVVKIDG